MFAVRGVPMLRVQKYQEIETHVTVRILGHSTVVVLVFILICILVIVYTF